MTVCMSVGAFASSDFTVEITADKNAASVGEQVTLTVALQGTPSSRSGSLSVALGNGLELISGEMLTSGATIKSFDMSTNKGVAAFSSASSFDGDFARLVVSVTDDEDKSVSVTVKLNPSGDEVTQTYTISDPGATATVGTANAKPGDTVSVDVTLADAPNIKSLAVSDVTYDSTALELIGAEFTVANTILSRWDSTTGKGVAALSNESDINGVIFRLTFSVKSGARKGVYPVSLSVSAKDKDSVSVPITAIPGSVNVNPVIIGDVNGDGIVNMKDLQHLKKYLSSMITVDEISRENSDIGGDGLINIKDLTAIKILLASA